MTAAATDQFEVVPVAHRARVLQIAPGSWAGRAPAPRTGTSRSWQTSYVRSIAAGDLVCACVASIVGMSIRFSDAPPMVTTLLERPVTAVAVFLPLVWVAVMFAARAYEQRFLFGGAEEFRRVLLATVWMLAVLGTSSWAFTWDLARGFVLLALPLCGLFTLVQRYLRREVLHRQRLAGLKQQTTLLVGPAPGVQALQEQIERHPYQGMNVVGACVSGPSARATEGLPVLGGIDDVVDVVLTHGVDVVAVVPCSELDGPTLRELGWGLERTRASLLLAPALTQFAGPRVAIRQVAGLPLMHVDRPELTGLRRLLKAFYDYAGAVVALAVLGLPMLGLALVVKLTSPGPALYRQERIGRAGARFHVLKFRSMVDGADRMVDDLRGHAQVNSVLFKLAVDPRVTSVGRWMRKFSLDELPQLLNVALGQMSLVGPRPPLEREIGQYTADMHRRFLVKPGITGLWQVSGRSDLSWEDSARLDIHYVENWSFGLDIFILWKTIRAVRTGRGAY